MKFENREANYDFEIYRLYYKLVICSTCIYGAVVMHVKKIDI